MRKILQLFLLALLSLMTIAWNSETEAQLDEAGANEWEKLTVRILQEGSSMGHLRQSDSIVETDCGAFGFFHLQPHQSEHWGIYTDNDCPVEDPMWREALQLALLGPSSVQLQLEVWRGLVSHIVRRAEVSTDEERAAVAAIANSSPSLALRAGEATNWQISKMLDLYCKARPNSEHRRRRAACIRELILRRLK